MSRWNFDGEGDFFVTYAMTTLNLTRNELGIINGTLGTTMTLGEEDNVDLANNVYGYGQN